MKTIDIRLSPEESQNDQIIAGLLREKMGLSPEDPLHFTLRKRSIDARKRDIKYQLRYEVSATGIDVDSSQLQKIEALPQHAKRVVIVGAGPAGLFAGLKLLELGIRPIILERGKDVRARRRDLAVLNRDHIVNSDSNYCFGEGGAGTYSDGKLYTRSHKRGTIASVLQSFVEFGADPDILIDAHPHIGTNKLPEIIVKMRKHIENLGGEVHFECKMTDFRIEQDRIGAVLDQEGISHEASAVILATGHSARDIYRLFDQKGWTIEAKAFALGVRVEHPQSLIDQAQYHRSDRGEILPPAAYTVRHSVGARTAYSFCMCPGGIIAPCATEPGEIVTNGWSPSRRNNPFANSGMVVEVRLEDLKTAGPLAALDFQSKVEKAACQVAGGTQSAPALRLVDFVEQRVSSSLPKCSYQPGTSAADFRDFLPKFIHETLRQGFIGFSRKIKGFLMDEAIVLGPESRTSSPVRIPRDCENLQHPQLKNLYPCGEGAGYAGGIVSAALDGIRCAEKIAEKVSSNNSSKR